jgi:hypothetical protein
LVRFSVPIFTWHPFSSGTHSQLVLVSLTSEETLPQGLKPPLFAA